MRFKYISKRENGTVILECSDGKTYYARPDNRKGRTIKYKCAYCGKTNEKYYALSQLAIMPKHKFCIDQEMYDPKDRCSNKWHHKQVIKRNKKLFHIYEKLGSIKKVADYRNISYGRAYQLVHMAKTYKRLGYFNDQT